MQVFLGFRPFRAAAVLFVTLALIATACSGGARPTVTTDRLVETPAPTATAVPTAAPATAIPADAPTATAADDTPSTSGDGTEIEQLVVEILETWPHDETAFTQGLELHDGVFLESTGLYGESELRRVTIAGEVTQRISVPSEFFAEGLTKVGDQIIQLTWRENTAFFYDATSFELTKEVAYTGEGWGLCYDGARLVMTDGTPVLIFRDPTTFDETGRVDVTLNGEPVWNLNEAECVDGQVWANIWQTDLIVRIDPASGVVTGVVDAASLDAPQGVSGAVLNGIAWDAGTSSFYVTGKLWPTMYRVNFVAPPDR